MKIKYILSILLTVIIHNVILLLQTRGELMNNVIHPTMIYFVEKECTPAWKLSNENIPFYDLLFVISGTAEYLIDDVYYKLAKGDILFIKTGSTRIASTTGMKCISIDFLLKAGDIIELPTVTHLTDFDEYFTLFNELKFEWLQKADGYQLKSQALFALILHKILFHQTEDNTNPYVRKIKRFIIDNYMEDITIHQIAELLKIHPVYCGALFKKSEGISIHSFLMTIRINKAVGLFQSGEYNVSAAAEASGFKDVYYFSATFKKIMKMSPQKYRKMYIN